MIIILSSCKGYVNNNGNRADKFFVNWNIATVNSIKQQEKSIKNEYEKSLYKNRFEAFKAYIDDLNQFNKNSIRYKLIDKYLNAWGDKFYIVEANESGEKVHITSYIILPSGIDSSKILRYTYESGNWNKVSEFMASSSFKFDRISYNTKFGEGKNENDITVTFIENNNIISSDFFLNFTMKQIDILNK